jgi:hypothetical protein
MEFFFGMGRGRIKLKPLGNPSKAPPGSSSSKSSGSAPASAPAVSATGKRKAEAAADGVSPPDHHPTQDGALLISRYHALLKYVAQAKVDPALSVAARASKVKDLERQLAELGGIEGTSAPPSSCRLLSFR